MDEPTTTRQAAIVVIGSGFAGLSAAIEAAKHLDVDAGEGVLIVEKMEQPGGNSVINGGQIAAVGSDQQQLSKIEDSVALMMQDMLKAGVDLNHPNLIRRMIEESNATVEWLQNELNIQFRTRVTQLGGHSVPRTLSTLNASGEDIIGPMLDRVQQVPNIDLRINTAFEDFIMSQDGRKVEGVRLRSRIDGHLENILCSKGVILAAGGFGADVRFRSIQNPSFDEKVMTTNQPGATAEVLKQALKIGAMSVQLSRIQLGPWTSPDETGFGTAPFFCGGAGFPYGIIVDPVSTKRFVNELANRYERSMAILGIGHPAVCLTDSNGAQHSLRDVQKLAPTVKRFSTLEDLAKEYGMNDMILLETVANYNVGVEAGVDAEFGKPLREDLLPIATPPFYATRLWPKVHHCMGGLHINSDAQVMHIDGEYIPGLFAAGEIAGGIHGGDRLGSCATLDCIAFGRIAGRSAAVLKTKID